MDLPHVQSHYLLVQKAGSQLQVFEQQIYLGPLDNFPFAFDRLGQGFNFRAKFLSIIFHTVAIDHSKRLLYY